MKKKLILFALLFSALTFPLMSAAPPSDFSTDYSKGIDGRTAEGSVITGTAAGIVQFTGDDHENGADKRALLIARNKSVQYPISGNLNPAEGTIFLNSVRIIITAAITNGMCFLKHGDPRMASCSIREKTMQSPVLSAR